MASHVARPVEEVANTGFTATDDKFVLLPLAYTRQLLAFDGADRVVVKFTDHAAAEQGKAHVQRELQAAGLDVDIKDWREVSQYYSQVKGLFDLMSLFFGVVVALIVMATVANTMSMSILERTRETATLRALGMQPGVINRMFLLEGVIVTGLGTLAGAVCALLAGQAINAAKLTYTPPDASAEALLEVTLLSSNLAGTAFTLLLIGAACAYMVSRRITKRNIVEALAHA